MHRAHDSPCHMADIQQVVQSRTLHQVSCASPGECAHSLHTQKDEYAQGLASRLRTPRMASGSHLRGSVSGSGGTCHVHISPVITGAMGGVLCSKLLGAPPKALRALFGLLSGNGAQSARKKNGVFEAR